MEGSRERRGGARPVIAQAYLNEWISRAPWPTQIQIEQDLVLSRLIVEIANHELLGAELALRGGTCSNKLHLPESLATPRTSIMSGVRARASSPT